MIPHSFVSGTFYDSSGVARANQQITFMPLSTPYAVAGELVLSTPQIITLDFSGRIHDGTGNLYYKLAKGYYRVIASDTDAFFISVSDDELVHDIDSLATEVGGLPSELARVLTTREVFSSTADAMSVTRTLSGQPFGTAKRFLILGETGDLSADPVFPDFTSKLQPSEVVVLGNANPGGLSGTIAARLAPWSSFIGSGAAQHFWYALGDQDWLPGNVNAVTSYLTTPGQRYYKQTFTIATGVQLALFVVDSNVLEPDGNTSASNQAAWLQVQLSVATERWKVVVFRDTPFVSVTGKSSAAMNWPFAQWGAHAVVAAGANVAERITLTGSIPLFVVGSSGLGSMDAFGTPLANSVFRSTTRAGLVMSASLDKLSFHYVALTTGTVLHQATVAGAEDQPITFAVNFAWNSGFQINRSQPSLELEPYGLASKLNAAATPIQRLMEQDRGGFLRMSSVPSAAEVAAAPWLKNFMIAVGDDPVHFYWWNNAKGDFVPARFLAEDGYSYYSGSRTQLSLPTTNPAPGTAAYGTVIDHADQTVEIWVSEDGGAFIQWGDWPTRKFYVFQAPSTGRPKYLAVFARKSGYIDSAIWAGAYPIPS